MEYLEYLEGLTGNLGRAWREGDWDLFEGQFFTEFRKDMHVTRPFKIPDTFRKFGGLDFGSTNPFAFYWVAVDWDGNYWVYREYYKTGETAENNAKAVATINRESGDFLEMVVGDRAMFHKLGYGETIGDIMRRNGIGQTGTNIPYLEPSIGGKNSRVSRAQMMRQKLYFNKGEQPKIKFFDTCVNAIRTIPALVHDRNKPEDVDTRGEDHSYDAITYLLQKLEDATTEKPRTSVEQKFFAMKKAEETSIGQSVNTRFNLDV
ncbi:MAG: hypothetical protein IH939_09130 [Acidobacteria bacterium]|nr:hypothetical protein [Acidobacteriota bacterium]